MEFHDKSQSNHDTVAIFKTLPKELRFLIGIVTGGDINKKKRFVKKYQALFNSPDVLSESSEFMMQVTDTAFKVKLIIIGFVIIFGFLFLTSGLIFPLFFIAFFIYLGIVMKEINPLFKTFSKPSNFNLRDNVVAGSVDVSHMVLDVELRRLVKERDAGKISDEEYDQKRLKILDQY